MLFFAVVSAAFAQTTLPATDKAFTVVAEGHNSGAKPGWAINNEGTKMVSFGNTAIANEAQKNFAFVQYDGKVYLYSVSAQKFVQKDMSLSASLPIDDIKVENVAGGKFYFKYDDLHNMNIGGSKQLAPDSWSTKDGGNQYTLTEVADFDPTAALAILDNSCTITYNFIYDGNVVATQVTKINKGANYPAFTSLPWGVVAEVPAGTADADETVQVTCTIDTDVLPFEPSSSYADAKWYYLNIGADAYYLYHTADANYIALNKTAVDESAKDAYTWAFIGNPFTGYKIVNRATGNGYILSSSTDTFDGNTGGNTFPIMTAEPVVDGKNTYWEVSASSDLGENGFYIAQKGANNGNNKMNNRGSKLAYWNGGADAGSTFKVVERTIAAAEVTVVYKYSYNGDVKDEYTHETTTTVGAEYPALSADLPYGVTGTKPEGTIDASDVVDGVVEETIELSVNLPFEATEDVNAINKWYFMQMHSNTKRYIEYIAGENYMEWTDTEVNAANRDAYMWAFVGNIWDGFKLVNKAATTAKAIKSEGSGNPGMDTFDNGTSFVLKKSKVADKDGFVYFCLQYPGPNREHLNAQDGKVAHWWDTDAGSAINLCEIPTLDAELATLIAEIEAKNYDSYVGGTVGCLTAESVAALKEAIANAKNVQDADTDDLVALQNAAEALEVILPQEGRFYTIESALYENDYIYAGTNNKVYHNTDRTNASSEAIWQFVKNDDGSFRLYSVSNNQYISNLGWQVPSTLGNASEMKFTFEPQGNGVVFIKGNGNEMHAQLADRALVYYNTNTLNSASSWIVKEVTNFTQKVNVSSVGYSTLVLGYNAEIPADVEAYTVSKIGSDYVTLSEVTGVLPAGEAVVLIAPEAEYSFNYSTGTLATISENLLEGTLFDTYIEGAQNKNYYVLSKPAESEVGLYKADLNKDATGAAGTTHFKNNAFKAYLPLTTTQSVQALRFNFGGETTGVDAVEVVKPNAPIYDLSGRRVLSTVKGGVYIQNGKKFIVK